MKLIVFKGLNVNSLVGIWKTVTTLVCCKGWIYLKIPIWKPYGCLPKIIWSPAWVHCLNVLSSLINYLLLYLSVNDTLLVLFKRAVRVSVKYSLSADFFVLSRRNRPMDCSYPWKNCGEHLNSWVIRDNIMMIRWEGY